MNSFFSNISEMIQNVKFWNAVISSFLSTKLNVASADGFVFQDKIRWGIAWQH